MCIQPVVNPRTLSALPPQAPTPSRQPTPKANKKINQKHHNHSQQDHKLDVLPPHPPPQPATPHAEVPRRIPQPPRLINQQIQPLAPIQHALNILRHNLPHALNLPLRRPQRIVLAGLCAPKLHHKPLHHPIEARTPVRRERRKVGGVGVEGVEEALLERGEEAEGDALAEGFFGYDEEGQAAGGVLGCGQRGRGEGVVVREVGVYVEGFVLCGGVGEFGEDDGEEGGGV